MQKLRDSQVPQAPQRRLQHSLLDLHPFPTVLHSNPQTPAEQTPVQQLASRTHGSPSALHEGPLDSGRVDASSSDEGASPFTAPASYEVTIASGCVVDEAIGSKGTGATSERPVMSLSLAVLPPHAPAAPAKKTPMTIIRTNRIRLVRIPPGRD